jgi:hypothetical protein
MLPTNDDELEERLDDLTRDIWHNSRAEAPMTRLQVARAALAEAIEEEYLEIIAQQEAHDPQLLHAQLAEIDFYAEASELLAQFLAR